jgi:hypothetical protein
MASLNGSRQYARSVLQLRTLLKEDLCLSLGDGTACYMSSLQCGRMLCEDALLKTSHNSI